MRHSSGGAWRKSCRARTQARIAPISIRFVPGCHLQVAQSQRAELGAWLEARGLAGQPLILVQIGNKRTMRRGPRRLAVNNKYWPLERWAEVLQFMRQHHPRHAIVLLGTGPEYQLNRELASLADIRGLHNVADEPADSPPAGTARTRRRASSPSIQVPRTRRPPSAARRSCCSEKHCHRCIGPGARRGADVQLLRGEIAGEATMLGIEAGEVIGAWSRLKLARRGFALSGRRDGRCG